MSKDLDLQELLRRCIELKETKETVYDVSLADLCLAREIVALKTQMKHIYDSINAGTLGDI